MGIKNKNSFKTKNKKGYFFSLDALIALLLIIGVVLFIKPSQTQVSYDSRVHEDLLSVLSDLQIGEINNSYVKQLIANGDIKKLNQSVLEQIGEFYASSNPLANQLAQNILDSLALRDNTGLYFNDVLIASTGNTSFSNALTVLTSRQIISGIINGSSATGFSSRAFLTAENKIEYFYFGGYIGDGNITAEIEGEVISANIEGVFSRDFDLYINDIYASSHSPISNVPYKIDLNSNLSMFAIGKNTVEFKSTNGNLYIAGGYLKAVYNDVSNLSSYYKKKFPGIKGLINIYDSIYVPGTLNSMEVFLHYNSSFDIFMTIGNKSIYSGNSSGANLSVTIDNPTLSSILDYSSMNEKNIPIRLGIENVSGLGKDIKVDVISVTDLSGSMGGQKITDAKNANIELINGILNFSGNNVGLEGYRTWAEKSDFHALSNNSASLINEVNTWNAGGYTCICCGIIKAINCFDKNIFNDNFNDQTIGSNPTRWSVTEGNGRIRIISPGLEGNKAVNISRLSSQNPVMRHYFAPQEDKISVEFLVRHDSGTGRIVVYVEGANSGFSDFQNYIIIKMYDGWIRNNDAQVYSYTLNTNYKIKVEIFPGSNVYDLYVDDVLEGNDLSVYSTRTNIARVSFLTENSNVGYTAGNVSIFLTDEICNALPPENRSRVAIVMTDGQANRACGLDPVVDYDQDGDTTDDSQDHAIQAACDAKNKHNITVHAVGFGNGADTDTLEDISSCGQGNFYFGNVGELVSIYQQITQDIISTAFIEQTVIGKGIYTLLYSDSYISMDYDKVIPNGVSITTETAIFNNNISQGNFFVPLDAEPYEAGVVSYSGPRWTDMLQINSSGVWEDVFNLAEYNSNSYFELGDPYIVNIPGSKLKKGDNSVIVSTGAGPSNSSGGSIYDKVVYSIVKNISSYTPVVISADGCLWDIEFEDNTVGSISVPKNYTGSNRCYYNSSIPSFALFNNNDAIQISTYDLLKGLDLNLNGKIETKFTDQDLTINTIEITGIPFTWDTEVQARAWR